MTNKNGQKPKGTVLSAVGFLKLAEARKVREVNLAEVGYEGIMYVRALTYGEKQSVFKRPTGKTRVHKDESVEVDWSQLPADAAPQFLKRTLVTDATGTTQMWDALLQELGKPHMVMDFFKSLPSPVVELIVKNGREISDHEQTEDEAIDEKKGS